MPSCPKHNSYQRWLAGLVVVQRVMQSGLPMTGLFSRVFLTHGQLLMVSSLVRLMAAGRFSHSRPSYLGGVLIWREIAQKSVTMKVTHTSAHANDHTRGCT